MDPNPFRPVQRESYEQQLDLTGKDVIDESEELVDIGLSSSTNTATAAGAVAAGAIANQPKFLESSTSSLLPPNGSLGPSNKLLGGSLGGIPTAVEINQGGNNTGVGTATSRFCGFFSVDYYRPYFDVSSATVMKRMKGGMSPHKADLFSGSVDAPADLYGAIWISLTLVFLIAATSNLNGYFAHSSLKEPWERDYTLLTFASTMVLVYTFVIPLLLWAASLYAGVNPRPSLTKMIGVYGYTMTNFIAASILCVIPSAPVQWVVVILAGALSGIVLVRNLWTLFGESYGALGQDTEAQASLEAASTPSRSKSTFLLVCAAAATHAVFSLLLKLFFFQGADFADAVKDDTSKTATGGGS